MQTSFSNRALEWLKDKHPEAFAAVESAQQLVKTELPAAERKAQAGSAEVAGELKSIRTRLQLKQETFAAKLGLSRRNYSWLEYAKSPVKCPDRVLDLARSLIS